MYRDYGRYVFYLFLAMLVLVYFVGATKIIGALAPAGVQLSYAISGRNAAGNFPNYPK